MLFLCPILSKQRINPSTSKSFYFWKNPLCVNFFSDACGLYTFLQFSLRVSMPVCVCWVCCTVSMFDTMRMEWPVMRLMFLMSELQINLCVCFIPAWLFLSPGRVLLRLWFCDFRYRSSVVMWEFRNIKCYKCTSSEFPSSRSLPVWHPLNVGSNIPKILFKFFFLFI